MSYYLHKAENIYFFLNINFLLHATFIHSYLQLYQLHYLQLVRMIPLSAGFADVTVPQSG